jgi:polyisoprenyl-phosphate glycosyltransferase
VTRNGCRKAPCKSAWGPLISWRARQRAGDFRLLSPRAAAALRHLPERNRFFKGIASWIGFRQFRVDYSPAERAHGRSIWDLGSLVGLSVEGLTSFSEAPLRIASLLGILLEASALVFASGSRSKHSRGSSPP